MENYQLILSKSFQKETINKNFENQVFDDDAQKDFLIGAKIAYEMNNY